MDDHNLILQVERVVSFIKRAPFDTSVLSKYVAKMAKVSLVLETGNVHCICPADLLSFQIPHC